MLGRGRVLWLMVLLGLLTVTLAAAVPFNVKPAMALDIDCRLGRNVGGTEFAYDDGIPYKTVDESDVVCGSCLNFQGVRFGLGGVELATITSVRFYASVKRPTTIYVHINDIYQHSLLTARVPLYVSRNGWYIVPLPEVPVTGDFFVWIESSNYLRAEPFHDIKKNTDRSFFSENPGGELILPVKKGDLLIRATVRAEIHVGKEDQYKYHVIQEAVNAAGPFLTIVVHPGTYIENVTVDKDVSVISSDGPSVTIVEAATPGADVFNIASDGVAIDGFTIRGGSGDQVAGVRLADITKCSVSNNTILDNYYGVHLAEPSPAGVCSENVILQNVVTSNTYGIWIGGQRNNISGNHLESNTATQGPGIFLSDVATDNWLRFNSFQPGPGSDHTVQVYYDGTLKAVDAIQNWWGDPTGPYSPPGNPDGTGAGVGDMVEFAPWLGAEPLCVATGTADVLDYVLDARAGASTSVRLAGSGRPIIWVASYSGNPAGEFPTSSIGKWMDVCLSSTAGLDEAEITAYYTSAELGNLKEGDLRLYWWNGSEWVICSSQRLYKEEACIRATIGVDTRPGLSNLAGTPFAIGAVSGGMSFQWWWIPITIVLLIVLIVAGRFVLRLLSQGGQYDYE